MQERCGCTQARCVFLLHGVQEGNGCGARQSEPRGTGCARGRARRSHGRYWTQGENDKFRAVGTMALPDYELFGLCWDCGLPHPCRSAGYALRVLGFRACWSQVKQRRPQAWPRRHFLYYTSAGIFFCAPRLHEKVKKVDWRTTTP